MKFEKSKRISIPILSSLCLLGMSSYSFAQTDPDNMNVKELAEQLRQVTKEATQLQEEMKAMKAEMRRLQKLVAANSKSSKKSSKSDTPSKLADKKSIPASVSGKAEDNLNGVFAKIAKLPTVTTSPYIGLQSTYDGSDLVVNVSSMAEDLRLLKQRQALAKRLGGDLSVFEDRPVVIVSGKLEPTVGAHRFSNELHHRSDIDLDSSELDFLIEAGRNAFGFMSLAYDNQYLDRSLTHSPRGSRISNSNIYLKRGFITLGNLDKFPFYLSAGQMYTDFGRYTSNMIASTLPSKLGKTNARQVHLGYVTPFGLSASGCVFKGDTHTGDSHVVNEGGVNVRYKKDFEDFRFEIGGGYITNLADSETIQATGAGEPRQGFAFTNEFLFRRAPGINLYGEFQGGPWKFVSEYVAAQRAFDWRNLTYNLAGAKPKALQLELSREFDLFGKPSLIGISYNRSWESFAIALPRESYGAVFSTFPVKNVRFSLEYKYNKNYPANTLGYISGNPLATPLGVNEFLFRALPLAATVWDERSKGGNNKGITAQLSLYF